MGRGSRFMRRWLSLGLLALSGCGPDSAGVDPAPSGFRQWDSAGVVVSVTDGDGARAPLPWVLDSVPDLILGDGSTLEEEFFRITAVQGLAEGGVLVVDAGSRELRFFDQGGRLTRKAGGNGEGPGEFRDPALVGRAGGDSVLVWDTGLRRLELFSPDGLAPRVLPLSGWPIGAGARPPLGMAAGRLLVVLYPIMDLASWRTPGVKLDSLGYVWLDPDGGAEAPFFFSRSVPFAFNSGPGVESIPFSTRPSAVAFPQGAFITEGPVPEIRHHGLDGHLLRLFRIDEPDRPVTEAHLRRYLESRVAPEQQAATWERYRSMPIPEAMPWFEGLRLDELGWLWAATYQWDSSEPREWIVFDPEGRARGTVRTPPRLDVQWIGENRVLGIWIDDLGVEQVRAYRLARAP